MAAPPHMAGEPVTPPSAAQAPATSGGRVRRGPSGWALAGFGVVAVAVLVIAAWAAPIEVALFTGALVLLLGRLAWLVARRPGAGSGTRQR